MLNSWVINNSSVGIKNRYKLCYFFCEESKKINMLFMFKNNVFKLFIFNNDVFRIFY